ALFCRIRTEAKTAVRLPTIVERIFASPSNCLIRHSSLIFYTIYTIALLSGPEHGGCALARFTPGRAITSYRTSSYRSTNPTMDATDTAVPREKTIYTRRTGNCAWSTPDRMIFKVAQPDEALSCGQARRGGTSCPHHPGSLATKGSGCCGSLDAKGALYKRIC